MRTQNDDVNLKCLKTLKQLGNFVNFSLTSFRILSHQERKLPYDESVHLHYVNAKPKKLYWD